MNKFKNNGHIDPDLFDVFLRKEVYLAYAHEFLDSSQIDAVDSVASGWIGQTITPA